MIEGKLYVLMPGRLNGVLITADKLAELYGVPKMVCVSYDSERAAKDDAYEEQNKWKLALTPLVPKTGEYKVPGTKWATKEQARVTWPFPVVHGKIPE